MRPARGPARPRGRRPGHADAQRQAGGRREQPDRDRRRRAGRRPGPGGDPRRAAEFASILGPSLATRDLLVYDQRGTGSSGRLTCPAFERGVASIVDAAAACANQLGPPRGFYRTADSVDDIEALRVESGYQKLVLFGVSYGTKVALDYAAKYPANVESLVLDSVVPPEGSDVLNVSTFKTMPRALGELCGNGACKGITTSVGHDLFNLVHKVGRKTIRGKVNTPGGSSLTVTLDQDGVLDILLAGDLNPTLRSELPGAMRSAIRDDNRPLLRLLLRAKGLTGIPDARASRAPLDEADSDALFAATRCEESRLPVGPRRGPRAARRPGRGRRQRPPGHRLPALQLQGRAAQRGDPGVRGVAERQPAAGAAHPAPGRAHAHPLGRLRPAHPASRTPPAWPRGSRAPSSSPCPSPATRSSPAT